MPMDYFVWLVRNSERLILVDTGFAAIDTFQHFLAQLGGLLP